MTCAVQPHDTPAFAAARPVAAARPKPEGGLGRRMLARIADWLAVMRQRRDLRGLDARQLADLGLTPEQASSEAARPFWDAPSAWRL